MAPDQPSPRDEETLEVLAVLGLKPPVSVEDVKQAYLEKAKTAHPDRGGDPQAFVRLHVAFEQATEYARFKAGRMQWLSGWVEQYAEQQALIDEIRGARRKGRRRERRMARPDDRQRLCHGHGPAGVG